MSKALFLGGEFQGIDDNGNPLAGGKVYFYEATTTTDKDVFTDSTLNIKHFQPVILDANGRAAIWMTGNYKVVLRDSTGVLIYDEDNVNTETSTVTSTILNNAGSIPINGSFENDDIISGTPDYWTLTKNTNGNVAIDATTKAHGLKSLKFTATDGNGGGEALSDAFNILDGGKIELKFSYFSSSATSLNVVSIIYDNGSNTWNTTQIPHYLIAGNPTSWTEYTYKLTTAAGMTRAKVRIQGSQAGGTPFVSTTNFDNVVIDTNPSTGTGTGAAFRGALAFTSVDFIIPFSAFTVLPLNATEYSTDLIHVLSDNSKLTVPSGVTRVRLTYKVNFQNATLAVMAVNILKNGSRVYAGQHSANWNPVLAEVNPGTIISGISAVINVTGGNYFQLELFHDDILVITAKSGSENTWFSMEVIE